MTVLLPFLALIVPATLEPLSAPVYSVPALAVADDLPEMEYTYIEGNYLWTDSDDADETLDGWEVTGSIELPLNLFLQGTASQQSDDADLDKYRLGAGFHLPIGGRLDAFGILSVAHAEIDGSNDDYDDTGVAAELGVRMLLTHKIEVNGSAEWVDVDDEEFGVGLGARYYVGRGFSLGGRAETVDSDETFAVGLRFEL